MGLTLDLVNTATLDVICLRYYEYSKMYRLFLSTESSTQASVSLADGKGSKNTVYFFIYKSSVVYESSFLAHIYILEYSMPMVE